LLLGLVKDLLHWLLNYLQAGNIKNQVVNQFTLVPQYPGLQHFSKPFHLLNCAPYQETLIWGMIRILEMKCNPILDYAKDNGTTAAEEAFDEMVMEAV